MDGVGAAGASATILRLSGYRVPVVSGGVESGVTS